MKSGRLGACLLLFSVFLPATALLVPVIPQPACEHWAAPPPAGDDRNAGTASAPWATLAHAAEAVPDNNCTVWFAAGEYPGNSRINRRFTTPTLFRAIQPYRSVFHHDGIVLNLSGATNVTMDGFVFRHSGPGASPLLVQVDGSSEGFGERVTLRNNIFHDSYNNDLLKILSGARRVLIENNVFYNQGGTDEHIDVNSVTDVTIQGNIFFNDFAGSGRDYTALTHAFITIKDSDEGADGQLGSERITVQRNIFLNWEGGRETLIQVGNDGKPYHEARDVRIVNNLFLGNSPNDAYAILGVRGVRDILFASNTVVGDFPSSAYALWVDVKDRNPVNENLTLTNNIWSDPTGSMGSYFMDATDNEFSKGNPAYLINGMLANNLYWNGPRRIPGGDLLLPLRDDARALVADPQLNIYQQHIVLPRWTGQAFASGNRTIQAEFVRLAELYGRLSPGSPAIGAADPATAPPDDLLGQPRSATPDLGAFEYRPLLAGRSGENELYLSWTQLNEPDAAALVLTYTDGGSAVTVSGIPATAREHTLTGLRPQTTYTIRLAVLNAAGEILVESNDLQIRTSHHVWCLPLIIERLVGDRSENP